MSCVLDISPFCQFSFRLENLSPDVRMSGCPDVLRAPEFFSFFRFLCDCNKVALRAEIYTHHQIFVSAANPFLQLLINLT
jgi:hypothetical protein